MFVVLTDVAFQLLKGPWVVHIMRDWKMPHTNKTQGM